MSRLKLYALPVALLLFFAGCKRDRFLTSNDAESNPQATVNIAAKDLVVPANFKFTAEKTLNVRVKVADAKANERYVIKIYSDVPATGKLISTGSTNTAAEYSTTIKLPAYEEFIYIEKINPDGSSKFEKVKANQFASAVFNNQQSAPYVIRKAGSGMDCNTGCTVTYNNPTSNITIAANVTACITGTIGSNVSLTLGDNSVAKICANGTFKNVNVGSGSVIYVLENTIVRFNKITDSYYYLVHNWSDSLVIDSTGSYSFSPRIFNNYGTCYLPSFSGSGTANNYGTLIINDYLYHAGDNFFYNHGYLRIKGKLDLFILGYFINYCHVQVDGNFDQVGYLSNYSYIKVNGTYTHYSPYPDYPPFTSLYAGSLISTANFTLGSGYISGVDGIIKINNNTSVSGGAMSSGTLCDVNGIESNTGGDISGATQSCSGYIATSTCNPEGFGSQSVTDSDNDGVADNQDEYPNDASRAFNSYYPTASTTATIAFEDLWPSQADYDFNDLSVALKIKKVLNSDNKVVECQVKMKVRAVGASYDNGFGFQFDELVPSDISSVSGQVLVRNLITRNANNTEAGQAKAVIIGFDSPEPTLHRATGSFFNTIKTNGTGTSDTVTLTIVFTSPVDESKLTLEKINPFMFTNRRRGYEVHLSDFAPTSLANTSLFGTFADRSVPGNNSYYKNANGMPWAILIPSDFYHPAEKVAITSAYNFFDDWIISGGSSYTNWYSNSPGNQNTNNIY
jgi:LruC domain-containing protein